MGSGGFPPEAGSNDIWYSADGKRWTRQTEHAPWTPRSPRTIVYKDRIWIFSGKHTGAEDNWGGDVWTMSAAGSPLPARARGFAPSGTMR